MSGMGEAGSLQRAHVLSAQASHLLQAPSPALATLTSALEAYRQAAELFSLAVSTSGADAGTLKTLQLLSAQHKKLVRDLERRIALTSIPAATPHSHLRRAATVPAPSAGGSAIPTIGQGRIPSDRRPTSPIKRPNEPAGLAAIGFSPSPFFASATSAPRQSPTQCTSGRALPPFAQRPVPSTVPSSSSSQHRAPVTLSPLYSSASSSDPDPAESYITFGLGLASDGTRHGGKEVDPFSKFWGMLEECLDEVSRPIAFASAPLGNTSEKEKGDGAEEYTQTQGGTVRRGKSRRAVRERETDASSPSNSYYMISADKAADLTRKERRGSPSAKTPEELILENESLRASLDALAIHTEQVDRENRELKKRSQEREAVLKTVADGAEKARLDTSVLLRSQVLSNDAALPRQTRSGRHDAARPTSSQLDDAGMVGQLKLRVQELEGQVKTLKAEHEKQNMSIAKYKDRFDKIKTSARAKKEARGSVGTIGKENG